MPSPTNGKGKRPYGTGTVDAYAPAKDGETRWRLRWRDNGRQRSKVVSAPTRKKAEELLRTELVPVDQGLSVEPSAMRVADLMQQWLDDEIALTVKATTLEGYRRTVETHVVPRLGGKRLQALELRDLKDFRARLVRECGACTAQRAFDRLNTALRWAHAMEWIGRDLTGTVKRPRYRPEEAHPLSAAELHAFLREATDDGYHPLWHLYAWTGLRRGEGLGLRWKDLDLDLGTLSVRQQVVAWHGKPTIVDTPKSSSSRRTIAINAELVDLLEAHRERQVAIRTHSAHWFEHGLVFCTRNGLPLGPNNIRKNFDRMAEGLGMPERTTHDLRHTHASLLLMRGVPLIEVSNRLGHGNVRVTAEIYAHWIEGSEERALDAIRGLMGGGLPELDG